MGVRHPAGLGDQAQRRFYAGSFRQLAAADPQDEVHYASLWERWSPRQAERYLIDEVHMTDEGYLYLASLVAEVLLDRGLVPTH